MNKDKDFSVLVGATAVLNVELVGNDNDREGILCKKAGTKNREEPKENLFLV